MPHKLTLITGGHGFLGSHALIEQGHHRVELIDISPIEGPICHKFVQGDLCDIPTCVATVQGVDIVMHFAAVIHSDSDGAIYHQIIP